MKTLQQKIAYELWATDPEDFAVEAIAGTPYQNYEGTLGDIEDVVGEHYKEEIEKLKKSLAYNAMLSVRFMCALTEISQRRLDTMTECVDVAKEALITPDFNSFTFLPNNT